MSDGPERADITRSAPPRSADPVNPWHALWAMMLGFFVILVDSTIVAVANPSIMSALGIGYHTVIWVTSAYLLGYAVPLLVAGRLGDQFGPKNLYLIGLAVFTAASLWCGLAGDVEMLITARAVQGVGAALLTPQTLSVITRSFPPHRRGAAMSVWGATAGVATLIGPLAGGVLVDRLGWEWIFFINVPIGVIGLVLAIVLIPDLPVHRHRFDIFGVALSGVGMFLLVFALQEGESQGWSPWIWAQIFGAVCFMAVFVYWQAVTDGEPLVPLRIFRDVDFGLANIGVAVVGFAVTGLMLPVMFYAQVVCGMSPTRSALLTAPMAITSGVLAPIVGRIIDRAHPRAVVGFGFSVLAIGLTWMSIEMTPVTPIWRLVLPFAVVGIGMAFIWSPLAATATRNLPPHLAGAGSGVYNATRQVGAVLGSAGMAAFMTSRIAADVPGDPTPENASAVLQLPEFLHEPFAAAMSEATLLPAFVALFGVVAALFMVGYVIDPARRMPARIGQGPALDFDDFSDFDDIDGLEDLAGEPDRGSLPRHFRAPHIGAEVDEPTEPIPVATTRAAEVRRPQDPVTEPLAIAIAPVVVAEPEPIPPRHNGVDVGGGRHLRLIANGAAVPDVLAKFGITGHTGSRRNRHYREDPDDADAYGRHARRDSWF
ncbi:MFS transporter [Mycolicibacter nonchromogenicus]|uniref:MFS transporter n=1 Tax=Mycolicibacter nonchromogenicus TaxID=1782 RepID=A0A1X1Z2D4_MYCNO|nr:MFS transporter [Mycolicibacter nonchromogenicus]